MIIIHKHYNRQSLVKRGFYLPTLLMLACSVCAFVFIGSYSAQKHDKFSVDKFHQDFPIDLSFVSSAKLADRPNNRRVLRARAIYLWGQNIERDLSNLYKKYTSNTTRSSQDSLQNQAQERVTYIGTLLLRVAQQEESKEQWRFVLMDTPHYQSYGLANKSVTVHRGLLSLLKTQASLAVVMAHHMSHILLQHNEQRIQGKSLNASLPIASREETYRDYIRNLFSGVNAKGHAVPFLAEHESLADYLSMMIVARACYDPRTVITTWQSLATYEKHMTPNQNRHSFLKTHPMNPVKFADNRVKDMQSWLIDAIAVYNLYCPHHIEL